MPRRFCGDTICRKESGWENRQAIWERYKNMAKENIRLLALDILLETEKKNVFVKDVLNRTLSGRQFMDKQDRAFITRIVEGVTEYQVRLDYVIDCFSSRKAAKCKPAIRCILRMGVYQILYMDSVPDEAACNECVKLAKQKSFQNLSGFVNGVLRSVARNREEISYPKWEEDFVACLSVTYSMPAWIIRHMADWYGVEKTKKILEASLETTDLTVRVNPQKADSKDLMKRWQEKGIEAEEGSYVPEAFHLKNINYPRRIPGFSEGEIFIQDESSMLLYHLTDIKKKEQPLNILDLCAAPGGKTTHFAQMLGEQAKIEARDVSEQKLELIHENIERLGLTNIQPVKWDALVPDADKREWADIVIADLPCSGFGIFSKKNDIKYHIKEQQLVELANLQRTILANAADYVKPGGLLLYSTCTINPAENKENAEWFLQHFPFEPENIRSRVPEELKHFVIKDNMIQLIPGLVKCDGFFIAEFRKK